jgi:hypothetical protein
MAQIDVVGIHEDVEHGPGLEKRDHIAVSSAGPKVRETVWGQAPESPLCQSRS